MIAIEINTELIEKAKHITEAMNYYATEYAKLAKELESINLDNITVSIIE